MGSWINNIGRNNNSQASSASQVTNPAAAGAQQSASPLAPAFDHTTARMKVQVRDAIREGTWLGEGFKACAGKFAFANIQGKANFHGYGSHKPQSATIRSPLPDGRLDVTVVMNVSGHDLKDAPNRDALLAERAKANVYTLQVTRPDGHVDRMTGIRANGELRTIQDISIRAMQPGVTTIEVWPEHSAGVGGYVEGRRLEITYQPPQSNARGL